MKINSKIKFILFLIVMLLMIFSTKVLAASISVGPSKSSVSPGESFSVSISASGATGKVSISVSNGSVSSSSLWLEPSGSVTVTAGSSGTVRISVTAVDMSDASGNEVSPSGSASVNIVVPQPPSNGGGSSSYGNSGSGSSSSGNSGTTTTPKPNTTTSTPKPNTTTKPEEPKKSSDATLKSLTVQGFDLYPEFSSGVNEYNVEVTNDITSIEIVPEVNDSKASFSLEGTYENLAIGENIAGVLVTAEDGATNRYILKINRERESLKLQILRISYIDEIGNIVELTPEIQEEIFDYKLKDIPYYINKLDLEALSNLENAKIEIMGNEELVEGENVITIKITMPAESEEVEEEILTYTFTVNKETAPKVTLIGKIKNWFKGITGTFGTWYNENQYNIVMGALMLCSAAMGGLTVYLIMDYKKYRKLVEKVAEITRMNTANANNIQTEAVAENNTETQEEDETKEQEKSKGRHF